MRLARPLSLLIFALLGACVPSSQGSTPKTPDGKSCATRLVGEWRFVGFVPDPPIPEDVRQSIERLHGGLRVGFDGQRTFTTGPGLSQASPYQVQNDDGLSCRLLSPDEQGAVSETWVRFLDANHLELLDRRPASAAPGTARLERTR